MLSLGLQEKNPHGARSAVRGYRTARPGEKDLLRLGDRFANRALQPCCQLRCGRVGSGDKNVPGVHLFSLQALRNILLIYLFDVAPVFLADLQLSISHLNTGL